MLKYNNSNLSFQRLGFAAFSYSPILYFVIQQQAVSKFSVFLSGFMTTQEKELFSAVPANEFNTYWIPCTWFIYRIQEASKKGKLVNEYALETIMRVSVLFLKRFKRRLSAHYLFSLT